MKKTLWLMSLFLFSLLWICNAADSTIGNLSVKFCNDETPQKELKIIAETEKNYDICMKFSNNLDKPITIKYGFVDGVLTDDVFQHKACTTDTMTNFGQFVTQTNTKVTIPANGSIEQNAMVNFPTWMAWSVNGCLVYTIVDEDDEDKKEESTSGTAFDIVVRKAAFINAFVGWEISRDFELNGKIRRSYNYWDNLLTIIIPLINNGNIEEISTFEGDLTNIFHYQHGVAEEKNLLSKTSYDLTLHIEDIPWYQMFYTLTWHITHEGKFSFDSSMMTEDTNEVKTIPVQVTIFIFPRLLLIIIIGAILLIWGIRYLSKHLRFEKEEIKKEIKSELSGKEDKLSE